MMKLVGGLIAIALTATTVHGQALTQVYTEPAVPGPAALDRLNLKLDWYTYVPTDRRHDGIHSMAVLDSQVILQTRAGAIIALDVATGAFQWRTAAGMPHVAPVGFGSNSRSIFIVKGVRLFSLDRVTGVVQWSYYLPHSPSAGPAADEDRLYIPLGTGSLYAFELPKPGVAPTIVPVPLDKKQERLTEPTLSPSAPSVTPSQGPSPNLPSSGGNSSPFGVRGKYLSSISSVMSGSRSIRAIGTLEHSPKNVRSIGPLGQGQTEEHESPGPQPVPLWEYLAETRLEISPLLSSDFLLLAGYSGAFYAMSKFDGRTLYHFQAGPPLTAPIGSHGGIAYVASEDYTVYALDSIAGRILWRFAGGGPILRKPRVTDDYVFVMPERAGMYCLERATGETLWRNPDAMRYLAMNKKFVYAMDRSNRLLILDTTSGRLLATWDGSRDYVVPLSNERTDRVFLGSNNGLLVCLHDRDFPRPVLIAHTEEPKAALPGKQPVKPNDRRPMGEDRDRPAERPPVRPDGGAAAPVQGGGGLRAKLDKIIKTEEPSDKVPLADALTFLSERYDVELVLDEKRFKAAGIDDIGKKNVTLPKTDKSTVRDYLTQVLKQVGATFEIKADKLNVIPIRAGR